MTEPSSPVTDELVERAWAAIVGNDVAPICFQASIVRGDLRTALEAAFRDVRCSAGTVELGKPEIEVDETSDIMDIVWRNHDSSFSVVLSGKKLVGIKCTVEPPRSSVAWTVDLPAGLVKIDHRAMSGDLAQPSEERAACEKIANEEFERQIKIIADATDDKALSDTGRAGIHTVADACALTAQRIASRIRGLAVTSTDRVGTSRDA